MKSEKDKAKTRRDDDNSNNKVLLQRLIEATVEESFLKEDLVGVFAEPFMDIFKTAKHGLETSIKSITGNVKKVAMQLGAAALPFIASSEVTRLGADENEKIKAALGELDSEYADVLQRNWDTLRTRDVAGLAILFNPSMALGGHAALQAPALGLGVLEILTGGHPAVRNLRQKAQQLSTKVLPPTSGDSAGGGSGGSLYDDDYGWGGDFGEAVTSRSGKLLLEQQPIKGFTKQQLDQKVAELTQKLIARKDVQQALQNSLVTKALKTSALDAMVERAQKVATFTTVAQFEQHMGSEFQKFAQQIENQIPRDTDPQTLQEFEKQQVLELKKAYKKFYEKYLQDIVNKTPGIGPEAQKAQRILNKLG